MRARRENMKKRAYTPYPERTLYSTDTENMDVANAGPMARVIEARVCERPFVAPSDALFGAAAVW